MRYCNFLLGITSTIFASGALADTPITWGAPVAITSADQALFAPQTVETAVAWGGAPQTVTLTGGATVAFSAGAIDGSGPIGVTGPTGITGPTTANYSGTGNSGFNAVLDGFAYDGYHTITLNGLTAGNSYSIQLFSLDNRPGYTSRTQTFTDSYGNSTAAYAHGADDYVLGFFVADGSSETLFGSSPFVLSDCSFGQPCTNLNAAVLRGVPEPSTWALMLIGLGSVGGAMRRRGRTVSKA